MRFSGNRRSAIRVRGGRTHKKNNWRPDPRNYYSLPQAEVRVERRSPRPGFRHLLTVAQLRAFLDLLPEWEEVAVGLDAIVLDDGSDDSLGWHMPHVIAVCAWEQNLWWEDAYCPFEQEDRHLLDLLGVERCDRGERLELRWSEGQVRAFQLLHVLPHELGHHHDRVTTRSQRSPARGERYAESYATRTVETVWDDYVSRFGLP